MPKSKSILAVLLSASLLLVLVVQSCRTKSVKIDNLRCEYMHNPMGIDVSSPRFTWNYETASGHDFKQGSIQLLVSKSPDALSGKASDNVWRSEIMSTEESFITTGSGYKLEPNTTYFWQIIAWDK